MRGEGVVRPAGEVPPATNEHPDSTDDARLSTEIAEESARLVADPRGEVQRLERVAQRGESAATPMLAISGVALFIGIVFVVALSIAFTAYLISQ